MKNVSFLLLALFLLSTCLLDQSTIVEVNSFKDGELIFERHGPTKVTSINYEYSTSGDRYLSPLSAEVDRKVRFLLYNAGVPKIESDPEHSHLVITHYYTIEESNQKAGSKNLTLRITATKVIYPGPATLLRFSNTKAERTRLWHTTATVENFQDERVAINKALVAAFGFLGKSTGTKRTIRVGSDNELYQKLLMQ